MRLLLFSFSLMLSGYACYAQTNYVSTTPSAAPGSDNTLVGVGAGNLNMSGASNLFIGRGTGTQNMAGTQNVFLGASSGTQNTAGQGNSFIGFSSGYSNTTGNNNTFFGSGAGYTNNAGFNNLFLGQRSGYFNAGGNNNAFLGTGAGYANSSGSNNVFVGSDAGSNNSSGDNNVFAGSLAGSANKTGQQNVFIGNKAGAANTTAAQNVFIGAEAGSANQTGVENIFVGYQAGSSNTNGVNNTFIGYIAGSKNTGINNTFIGQRAGTNNTTGINNLFLGATAGANNVSGNGNFMMGNAAGNANSTGSGNIYIGDGAGLKGNTSNNIAIGQYAGNNLQGNSTNNVSIGQVAGAFANNSSNSVFLGKDSGVPQAFANAQLDNVVTLGAGAQVTQSNSVILGNNANVGIGTSAPNNKLEVVSGSGNTSGLRLTNLKSGSPVTRTTSKFLTVDDNGDVVLGSTTGGRVAGESVETQWQLTGDNLVNANAGSVVIGPGVSKTPAGYRLFVSEGILTEKVKVAVANTSEWSDKVFEKSYNLRSLNQVEQHIKAHGHLPGVPSADQVVREGIDVGKMDAKLLEKIEELTLYMIELKKETQVLKAENKRIKQQLRHAIRR